MHVDLIHTGISAAYFSLWIVIANVAVRRNAPADDEGHESQGSSI